MTGGACSAYSSVIDGSENVYTGGLFNGTVNFNPTGTAFNLTSNGAADIFLSKWDASGNFIWVKQIGGTSDDYGRSITIDANGDVIITGHFQGTVDFDPNGGVTALTSATSNYADVYVAKISSAGNLVWAKRMGGSASESAYGIAVDNTGNVYTTGHFIGTADFDPSGSTYELTSAGDFDAFVSKLDANGSFLWAKQLGGTGYELSFSITIDNTGNVYSTGQFVGTADFDPSNATFNLTCNGTKDIFVSKLNTNGDFIWAKKMGGAGSSLGEGRAIAIDPSNNVYITGDFIGSIDFDPDVAYQ